MRIAKPPATDELDFTRVLSLRGRPELTAFVNKANTEYYHWDELRRRPPPMGLTPEQTWSLVKMSRLNLRPLPLLDSHGQPFRYWLPDQATQILHAIDRKGGGALALDASDPEILTEMRDRVLIDSLMEEAIATSQIEGAVTTRLVAKEMLRSGRKPRDKSERMIANGYQTIRLLKDRTSMPMSVELLHEIQLSMTRDTLDRPSDAGRFRAASDKVCVIDNRDDQIVFTPPPAEGIPSRMQRLIEFANATPDAQPFIHPLIRAVILHFWLAYEHPYADGNGRTARALFYWAMLRSGYWLFEFLTISRVIHASRMQYYRAFLYSEHDDNDLTYFLMNQLDVTRRALEELHQRLAEMRQQQVRMKAIRLAARLNPRQRALLDHALRHPNQIYTFESHQHSHGVTYQTARTDLLSLADKGLLAETGSLRPREFVPVKELPRRLGLNRRA